ncbi:MAG TPA: hypothetical protein VJ085_06390 [Candidatus Acidoferrales bacterium]|nr:hypothetical protein [Candidatus Acidoferrales bacterium]
MQPDAALASARDLRYLYASMLLPNEVRPMKDVDTIAAILTVAFYTARGGAMSLPQILATYNEIRGLLAAQSAPRKKKR